MNRVILVLSDALRYDTALECMGFLNHLVESRRASLYKAIGELPSLSRPMYETVHTGLPVSEHGIVANLVIRRSTKPNVFELAAKAGKVTAASAYFWFSELYNRCPYDVLDDREVDNPSLAIQHGRFYTQDEYSDQEVFYAGGTLVRKFMPDYLLVHPLGMDVRGETYGSNSSEYRNQATQQDKWLAPLIAEWMGYGYNILVTADHGINSDKMHGGTTPELRELPLYLILSGLAGQGDMHSEVSQLQLAPTILKLLDLPIPEGMKSSPII